MTAEPPLTRSPEGRFGWLELLATILVVSLLLGLLLPAVGPSHRRPRRVHDVRVDISRLEDAIMQFKVTFGVEPPSRVVLHAEEPGWDADQRSKGLIRQLWPKFDFTNCGSLKNVSPKGITLNGSECLVFFLGGFPDPVTGEFRGFANDAAHPFSESTAKRVGPFFDFKGLYHPAEKQWVGRLQDRDGDGFPEYLDPFATHSPYLYASSYSGQGYRIDDLGGAMQDVYRNADGVAHKPKGIQIISAGADGKFGSGGVFDPQSANETLSSDRKVERDNVTNFSTGTLGDVPEPRTGMWVGLGGGNLILFILVAVVFKLRSKTLLLLAVTQIIVTGCLVLPMIVINGR